MKKVKLISFMILCVILLQGLLPMLSDIDWGVVFAEDTNTWDISEKGDGSVIAVLSDDGTLTISGSGNMKNISCFEDEKNTIKKVIINDGVTSIGNYAFYYCKSLTSIDMPNSITNIGNSAFYCCESLTSINIPNSVTSIGNYAFYFCKSLTSINIPNGVTSIENGVFYYCESLTSINIPNSVTSIGDSAFNNCSSLISINIPNSVTSIGNYAFYYCKSLTNIDIPDSVTSIGKQAFVYSDNLISINVSEDNENYLSESGVLYTKDKTELIRYPSKKNGEKYVIADEVTSIEDYAFYKCESLNSIEMPENVTDIGEATFSECINLIGLKLPDTVISIGSYAFQDCSSLTSINIPDTVISIGNSAFSNCSSLISINIPNGVTSIENYAFWYCESLTNIDIPDSVTSIGDQAFRLCRSLTSINISNSVTSIGDSAFENCESLTNIEIPESVTSIGEGVFALCENLISINVSESNEEYLSEEGVLYTKDKTKILKYPSKKQGTEYTISDRVIDIGAYAFDNCINLTNVNMQKGIINIGYRAFYFSKNLISVNIPESVIRITDEAFSNCSSLISVSIPNSITSIRNGVFTRCTNLTSINIPNSITTIPQDTFLGCTSLTSIKIPNSVTSIKSNEINRCENLTVYCKSDSYAEKYAKENSLEYVIDDVAPMITSITGNTNQWIKDNVTLTVNATDELTGLADTAYSFDNGQTWQRENTKIYTEKAENVVVKVMDAVGNIATQEVGTIKIDKQPPTISGVTGNEQWTKDSITLTVNATDELVGLAEESYSFDNGQTWQKENTKTYTEHTKEIIIKVRDALGNIAAQEIETVKIDKQEPTIISVTGNEQCLKESVTLTVNATDEMSGLAEESYSFDNGQTWQKENTKTYTENTKEIIIKVRDALGNISTYDTIDISNILKIEIDDYETVQKNNQKYLTKINSNTTISQLKEKIKTNGALKILKDENEVTDSNVLVGTGMTLQIEEEKYTIVVKADLNGDGKVGLSDLTNLKFGLIGKKQLTTESQLAGDVNGDEKMSLSDMAKLKMYLVEKVNI